MELFIKFLSQIADAVRYNFSVRILNLKITRIELERFESTIVDGLPNTFKKDFKMSRRIGARLCSTNHTAALQPLVSRSLIESDILYRVNFNLDSHHSLSLSFSPSFSVQSRLSRSLTRFLDILPLQRLLPLWMETFVSNRFAPLRQNNLYSFVRCLIQIRIWILSWFDNNFVDQKSSALFPFFFSRKTRWCTRDHNCLDTFFQPLVSADSPRYQRRYQRSNSRRSPFAVEWGRQRLNGASRGRKETIIVNREWPFFFCLARNCPAIVNENFIEKKKFPLFPFNARRIAGQFF